MQRHNLQTSRQSHSLQPELCVCVCVCHEENYTQTLKTAVHYHYYYYQVQMHELIESRPTTVLVK